MGSGLPLAHHRCQFRASLRGAGVGGLAAQGPGCIPGRGTVCGKEPGPPIPASSLPPQVVLWQNHKTGVRTVTAQCRESEGDLPGARKRDHERYEHSRRPMGTIFLWVVSAGCGRMNRSSVCGVRW